MFVVVAMMSFPWNCAELYLALHRWTTHCLAEQGCTWLTFVVILYQYGTVVSSHVIGKSEETSRVSTEHNPLGSQGLWGTPSPKVPVKQQLPAYLQNIAHALMRDHGYDES